MDFAFRMRIWHARLLDAVVARVRPTHVATLCLLALVALLRATSVGSYLELVGFVRPSQVASSSLDLSLPLAPNLGIVLADDRSLERLGHHPTLAEWRSINDLLARHGVKTSLLLDFPSLPTELGSLPTNEPTNAFYIGAVDTMGAKKSRALGGTSIPPRLLVGSNGLDGVERQILTTNESTFPVISGLGALNFGDETWMQAGFLVASQKMLPNLALRAAPGLTLVGAHWRDAIGAIPIEHDGELHVEFVPTAAILKRALPVSSFFDDKGQLAAEPSELVRERFRGVDTIVFAPEAHTGARFISTPFGKQPSYTAIVALVSGVLQRRYLVKPMPETVIVILVLLAACLLLRISNAQRSLLALTLLTVAWGGFAFCASVWLALLVPAAQGALVLLATLAARSVIAWRDSVIVRGRMQHEMETGRIVQEIALNAPRHGRWGSWEFDIAFKPYGALSGDWFQVFLPPVDEFEKSAVIAIGDVVGKGASAALTTSALMSTWSAYVRHWKSEPTALVPLLKDWQRMLEDLFKGEQVTTLSLVMLTVDRAYVVSCGAPPWMVINASTRAVKPFRVRPVNNLGTREWRLPGLTEFIPKSGDLLMTHTDGYMDGGDSRRAFSRLVANSNIDVNGDPFALLHGLASQCGGKNTLPDDATILVIKWRGAEETTSAA